MDNQIKIRMQNHSTMVIDSNPAQQQELRDHFSFMVPGARYMPAFKRKVWDGKIKLYNMVSQTLPVGLYHELRKFCADRFYPLQILEHEEYGIPYNPEKINHREFGRFLLELETPFEARDYQYDAIAHGIENKRAILLSPTGSGKSFIIYLLMRWIMTQTDRQILIVVPTTSLVEQMYKDFEEYGIDVQEFCHKIYSGKEKNTDKQIVISTWQSIYKFPKDWFASFDAVFGDEVHTFKAKSLTGLMDKSVNAKWRFGTTGTLDGTETNKMVLEGLFGSVYKVTTTVELQKQKTLAGLDIKVMLLRYHNDVCHMMNGKTYQEEIDYIIGEEKRNRFIRNLALSLEGNSLVLFQYVEKHGKPLYKDICAHADKSRKIFYVSGEVDASDREQIRGIVEKQKNAIIVASLGTFSTGINIKNLNNIVFATPSKSQIKVLQSIGRGLRKSDRDTVLYDIADDMHMKGYKNFTLKHSAERIKIYTKEGFKHRIYPIDLKDAK